MAVSTISSCGRSCRSLFGQLCSIWLSADASSTAQVSLHSIKTESDRYELWANNIAALQGPYLPTSLEYRIREDASARTVVEKALVYLEDSLKLALEIVSGERPNETWEETAPSDSKAGDTTIKSSSEIVELYLSIEEAVSNLFRLSMIIRKKPERDEYAKAATRYQIDPTSDIVHVGDKYPSAKKIESPWLMKRLGISITKRRQYLLYRREHQQRMQEAHKLKAAPDGNTVWSGTKASTYLPDENAMIDPQEHVLPMKIIMEQSQKRPQTEYADSSRGKDGATDFLRTPPLPMRQDGHRVTYGEHFECPYCWRVQNVENKYEWKKHVLSDLKPYICTFQLCELNMFEHQHDWFTHELQFHRKQWRCSICKERPSESRPDLISHLITDHKEELNRQSADVFVESCQIERIDATECPLCTDYGEKLQRVNKSSKCDVSLKQFQQHLGIHMQQLALAALPQDNTEEVDNEADIDSDIKSVESQSSLDLDQLSIEYNLNKPEESPPKQNNLYRILGVERDATQAAIESAAVQKIDPELHHLPRSESFLRLQRQYDVGRAYIILRDPEMRAHYDLMLSKGFDGPFENYTNVQPVFKNPYDILGVDKNASLKKISDDFLPEIIHYERGRAAGTASATLRFFEAQWAYEQLTNPDLRAICDKTIASQNASSTTEIPLIKRYNVDGTESKGEGGADVSVTTITVEGGDQSKPPISFVDAVGRRFSFPFDLCKNIHGMEELIRQAFLHVDTITSQVYARQYDLLTSDGKVIEPEEWEKIVLPGSSITMRMWPMLSKPSESEAIQAIVPKFKDDGWMPFDPLAETPNAKPPPPPSWATNIARDLRLEYPSCRIDCIMARRAIDMLTQLPLQGYGARSEPSYIEPMYSPLLRCLDCPGELYDLGRGKSVDQVREHLQSEGHINNMRDKRSFSAHKKISRAYFGGPEPKRHGELDTL